MALAIPGVTDGTVHDPARDMPGRASINVDPVEQGMFNYKIVDSTLPANVYLFYCQTCIDIHYLNLSQSTPPSEKIT